MYENVQEPFLNATSMAGDTRNDSGTNPFVDLLGAQEQGRNRSTNPPATGSTQLLILLLQTRTHFRILGHQLTVSF